MDLIPYTEVRRQIDGRRAHLLLGNGFSIACDPVFKYQNLFEFARDNGMTTSAAEIFERVGTNNFEAALRLLEDGEWVARHYTMTNDFKELRYDAESIKKALVEAVAKTHLPNPNAVSPERKARCADFLLPYHNVFTTNYDLLLYWVEMSALNKLRGQDGFREDPDAPDEEYVVFSEHLGPQKGIFYIHGGLHLFMEEGQIRKHSWTRSGVPLTDMIKAGIDEGRYPLFVAEGESQKKLDQIEHNAYLSYCLSKLGRVQNSLVTFGFSFGDSDGHIARRIFEGDFSELYVGIYGNIESTANRILRGKVEGNQLQREERGRKPMKVTYYDATSVLVWDG